MYNSDERFIIMWMSDERFIIMWNLVERFIITLMCGNFTGQNSARLSVDSKPRKT